MLHHLRLPSAVHVPCERLCSLRGRLRSFRSRNGSNAEAIMRLIAKQEQPDAVWAGHLWWLLGAAPPKEAPPARHSCAHVPERSPPPAITPTHLMCALATATCLPGSDTQVCHQLSTASIQQRAWVQLPQPRLNTCTRQQALCKHTATRRHARTRSWPHTAAL